MDSQQGCFSICIIRRNPRWIIKNLKAVTPIKFMIPLSVSKPESGFRIRDHWLKEMLGFQEKAPSDIVASIKKWFPSIFPQRPKQLIQGTELSRKGNPNLLRTFARGLNSQWHLDTQSASSDWSTTVKTWPGELPGGPVVKNLPASAGDTGSIPGLGRVHMLQNN